MTNIIERIDEFLEEKEPKEKYMIYGSIIVVFIIIYYYFNYMNLNKAVEEQKIVLTNLQSQYDISSYNQKLIKKRNEYINLIKQIKTIKNDLNKIKTKVATAKHPLLVVNDNKIFLYLKDIFKFSISKYIFPSYEINESINKLKLYQVSFKGSTNFNNFKNVISFVRYMEKNNFVSYVDEFEFNISVKGKRRFNYFQGIMNIWSYK